MKKYLSIILLISVVLGTFTLNSCKKGPNDPFLSLRSRKARMVGDWTIQKYSYERTDINIGGEQYYYKLAHEAEAITETKKWTNTAHDTTWAWNGKMIVDRHIDFDKHGKVVLKYHYIIDEFYPDQDEDHTEWTVDSTRSYERLYYRTGTWNFLSKIDEFKNKERVAIMWEYVDFEESNNLKLDTNYTEVDDPYTATTNFTNRQQTRSYYDNGEYTETWTLDKLKNKEIMMYRKIDQNTKHNEGTAETINLTSDGREQYDLEQE